MAFSSGLRSSDASVWRLYGLGVVVAIVAGLVDVSLSHQGVQSTTISNGLIVASVLTTWGVWRYLEAVSVRSIVPTAIITLYRGELALASNSGIALVCAIAIQVGTGVTDHSAATAANLTHITVGDATP